VVLTLVKVWIPFAALPILAARRRAEPALVEGAAHMGATPFRQFARVALFLAGTEPTFPVYLFSQLRFANRLPIMIALAVLMMIGSLGLVLIADRVRHAE
jgi:spermidine/putrescine transport system permease protein